MNSPRAPQTWVALPACVCSITGVWHQLILKTPPSWHSQLGWRAEKKDPASRIEGARGRLPSGPQRRRGHCSNHFLLPSTFGYGGCCHKSLLDPPSLSVRPSQSHVCVTRSCLFLPGSYLAPIGRAKESRGNSVGSEVKSWGERQNLLDICLFPELSSAHDISLGLEYRSQYTGPTCLGSRQVSNFTVASTHRGHRELREGGTEAAWLGIHHPRGASIRQQQRLSGVATAVLKQHRTGWYGMRCTPMAFLSPC